MNARSIEVIALVAIVAISAYLRVANIDTFVTVIEDEGNYLMWARLIAKGYTPYADVWMAHPPLWYGLQAMMFKIFGLSLAVGRLLNAFIGVAFVLVVYLLVRKIYGRATAFISASIIGFSPSFIRSFKLATPEILTIFLATTAFLVLMYYKKKNGNGTLFIAGLLTGMTFLAKYTGIVVLLFFIPFLAVEILRRNWQKNRVAALLSVAKEFAIFCIGAVIPVGIFLSFLAAYGGINQWYADTILWQTVARGTVHQMDWRIGTLSVLFYTYPVILTLISVGGIIAFSQGLRNRDIMTIGIPLSICMAFAYFFFISPTFLYQHVLPIFGIGTIVAVYSLQSIFRKFLTSIKKNSDEATALLMVILLVASSFASTIFVANVYSGYNPIQRMGFIFKEPDPGGSMSLGLILEVAEYLRNVTSPDDKIFTSVASFGFFADRNITQPDVPDAKHVGYFCDVFCYDVLGNYFGGRPAFEPDDIKRTLEKDETKIIIYSTANTGVDRLLWYGFEADKWYEGIYDYVLENYGLVKTFEDNATTIFVYERGASSEPFLDLSLDPNEITVETTGGATAQLNKTSDELLKVSYNFTGERLEHVWFIINQTLNLHNRTNLYITLMGDGSDNIFWASMLSPDGSQEGVSVGDLNYKTFTTWIIPLSKYQSINLSSVKVFFAIDRASQLSGVITIKKIGIA